MDFGQFEEYKSDDDNFSIHSASTPNRMIFGIQTSEKHFNKIKKTPEFQLQKQQRIESIDWALSSLFDDISFAKQNKSIRSRKTANYVP